MDENKMRFGVGVLVIAAIGIGVILTFLFGAFPALLNKEYTLDVQFDSAEGVNENTPVLRDGVKIGRVADIQLRNEGGVTLTLAMDAEYRMTHRYVPRIGIASLITGDSKVEFLKMEQSKLQELLKDNLDLIDKPYSDGEMFNYGMKSNDPFSVLFGMETELLSTFQSIRGAGDAVQDVGNSIERLVTDVRGFIGVTDSMTSGSVPRGSTPRGGGGAPNFPPQTRLPPAPAWASRVTLASYQAPARGLPSQSQFNPNAAQQSVNLQDVMAGAIDTLEEIQGAVADARAILGDENLRANLSRSIEKVPGVIDEAAETLQTTRETFDSFTQVSKQFEEVGEVAVEAVNELKLSANDTLRSFRNTAQNVEAFTKPFGERSEELAAVVLQSLANLDRALVEVTTFGKALNNSNGTVRRVLEDDELYFQVQRTIQNIEAATARIRPILDDVRVFTDKIARDPRQLGVKGALSNRPSGLGVKAR